MSGNFKMKRLGFSIIELIVVIVLLGILVATALPRFMDVDDEAHAAAVRGVLSGFQTGMSLYHSQWKAQGQDDVNTPIAEFNNLRVNARGYPYGTADRSGGSSTVTDASDCVAVFDGVLQEGSPSIGAAGSAVAVVGSTTDYTAVVVDASNCAYYYTAQGNRAGDVIPVLTYDSSKGEISRVVVTL